MSFQSNTICQMSKVKFKETQQYRNKLIPIVLGLIALTSIIKGIMFLFAATPQISSAVFLFVVAIAIGVLIWWLAKLKLKIAVTEKNIKFKLSPLHAKKHYIPWKDIEECEIIKTSEAAQWSGKNITYNHEKRYSLTGRNGLAIKTKKGEYFFIGCKNISVLRQTLDKMKLKVN